MAQIHEKFMRQALKLAEQARGKTSPNPLVGAVVVKKGKILGQGYHRAAGSAHAEVVALEKAKGKTQGSSLYVNLEPCNHFGRTGPCVQQIKDCAVKEVIFAMSDPNPLNNGRGAQALRRAGIRVLSGVLEEQARALNRAFVKYITRQLPFVTVKVAQSLDGKIATYSGDSRWISSSSSRRFLHQLRSQVDAILVGVNTALRDNPLLSARRAAGLYKKQPKKIIVDSRLKLRPSLRIFSARSPGEVIIATTRFAARQKVCAFKKLARVMVVRDKQGKVDLRDLMKRLAEQQITDILIEGGGQIIAAALEERLVDRMIIFIAPKIIGGHNAPTAVEGQGVNRVKQAISLGDLELKKLGSDLVIEGRII